MAVNRVETTLRGKRLIDAIEKINKEIRETNDKMQEAMKPYRVKLYELEKQRGELHTQLKKLQHSMEYKKYKEFVKNAKEKMTFKELVLKGSGTFGEYKYFLPSGTEVTPTIRFSIKKEFKNLKEFKEYLKRVLGVDRAENIDYGLSGYVDVDGKDKFTEGAVYCDEDTSIEVSRKLYLAGFSIGWNGEICVFATNRKRRYYRSPDKIIALKRGEANVDKENK